jgi:hypothetical protein
MIGIGGLVANSNMNEGPESLTHGRPCVHVPPMADGSLGGEDGVHKAGRHDSMRRRSTDNWMFREMVTHNAVFAGRRMAKSR